MRVLHLLASPFYSGPAAAVLGLAQAQRAAGAQVQVAIDRTRREAVSEELLAPRVDAAGLALELPLELSVKSSPLGFLRDARTLRALEVDVVHAHFTHDHLVARLGRPKGAALVRSLHAPRSLSWRTPSADGWTVPWEELAPRLLPSPVMVLPPLVGPEWRPPVDRPALRHRLGLPSGPLVGMVSTFKADRHHALGLEAFAQVLRRQPDAMLVLVGDGGLEASVRVLAAPLGDRVRFLGYRSGAAFVEALQALDEVWILGLGNDWAGRAAAEARACDVRVLAVAQGGLSRFADAVVPLAPEAIAQASLLAERRPVSLESPAAVAERALALYARARELRR
jgi:glycosyltransferase involved in cell wall biosynthesis